MKLYSIILLIFLLSSLAWGQASQGSSLTPATQNNIQMTEHQQHADYKPPATETSLLQSGAFTVAQGELPLSDFYTTLEPTVSLGQIAREYQSGKPVKRPKITVIP